MRPTDIGVLVFGHLGLVHLRHGMQLVVNCQRNKEYKSALLFFLTHVEDALRTAQANLNAPSTSLDESLNSATEPLIQLLENVSLVRPLRSC